MSHFTMMVITDERPAYEQLVNILEPYMEFECTGENTPYVVEIDNSEECLQEYEDHKLEDDGSTRTLMNFIEWYYGSGVSLLQDGETPDFEEKHKWGYYVLNTDGTLAKMVKRTNPNAHVDWWQVGGRWQGFLAPKPGLEYTEETLPGIGEKGLMGSDSGNQGFDVMRKDTIDIEGMRTAAAQKAGQEWDKIYEVIGSNAMKRHITWDKMREMRADKDDATRDQAKGSYHAQDSCKKLNEFRKKVHDDKELRKEYGWIVWVELDKYAVPKDVYVQIARDAAFVTYGYIKDGQWVTRGDMGWFGMSDEKMTNEDWHKHFAEMVDSLRNDQWITIIDCHI